MNGRTSQDLTEAEGSASLLTHEPVPSSSQPHGLFTESPSECIPAASKYTFIVNSFHQNVVFISRLFQPSYISMKFYRPKFRFLNNTRALIFITAAASNLLVTLSSVPCSPDIDNVVK